MTGSRRAVPAAKLKEKLHSSSTYAQMRGHTDDKRSPDVDRRGKGSVSASSVPMSERLVKLITPFVPKIIETPLPDRFNMPSIETYNGTSDPVAHLWTFESTMFLYGYYDNHVMCRAFVNTLGDIAMMWFYKLPPFSVSSYEELSKLFVARFVLYKKPKKTSAMLMGIKQHKGESLGSYIHRFNMEMQEVRDLSHTTAVLAVMEGLLPSSFRFSLCKKQPKDIYDLLARANKYINAEEVESDIEAARGEEARFRKPKRKRNHD